MKKFLVLMLVLGMASLASAAPTSLQISVHYDPPGGEPWDPDNPLESEIWLLVSETIILDIWTTTEIYTQCGLEGYFVLGVDPAYGTLSGGITVEPWNAETSIALYGDGSGDTYLPPPEQGILGAISTFLPQGSGVTGTVFNGIEFHCEAEGDAVINLYVTDWTTPTLIDSVIIHQGIPEPMTIALLGLGGLFLRRRRK